MTVPVCLLWCSLCGTGISTYDFPTGSVSLDAKTDENSCVLTPHTTSYCSSPLYQHSSPENTVMHSPSSRYVCESQCTYVYVHVLLEAFKVQVTIVHGAIEYIDVSLTALHPILGKLKVWF